MPHLPGLRPLLKARGLLLLPKLLHASPYGGASRLCRRRPYRYGATASYGTTPTRTPFGRSAPALHMRSRALSSARCLAASDRDRGRPLGYLVAWLRDQDNHTSKDEHVWLSGVHNNFDLRLKARQDFSALPGARAWLDKERARTAEEPHEEPSVVAS